MPISVALPSPQIEWLQELFFPSLTFANSLPQTASAVLDGAALRGPLGRAHALTTVTAAVNSIAGYGAVGTTGTSNRIENRNGRPCVRLSTTGTTQGDGIIVPDFNAVFAAPAGALNPGALQDPGALVLVWDVHLCAQLVGATPAWANDTGPMMFLPDGSALDIRNNPPGGPGPHVRGWGVFLNNVGGVPRFEYVSWNDANTILERVTIGTSIVPSITDWSTFRFVVVSAGSGGRDPSLSVQVNGFDIVTGRVFGGATLSNPAGAAGAAGAFGALAVSGLAGDQIFYSVSAKLGRFTPSGAELQGD